MSKSKQVIELTSKTMLGDLVKVCVEELRAAPDVWQKMPEAKQQDAIERMRQRCTKVIRDAVRLFSADGTKGIEVDVESLTAKEGTKITVRLSRGNEQAIDALQLVGHPALLVIADAEEHLGGTMPAADKDQRQLPLAEKTTPADNKAAADKIADAITSGTAVDATPTPAPPGLGTGTVADLPPASKASAKPKTKSAPRKRDRSKKK